MGEREFGRFERVAEQIRKELAWILEREMNDPRVGFVTISRVDVSKDLRNAKVFVAVREGQGTVESTRLLNRASGFLRGRLAARMRMRYVPHIRFANDETLDQASRIDTLLEDAKARRR
ncbi:MAG TPA: 30S ribosome-binding factor RbfA [Gammaproteobacteria bacterium]